MSAIHRTTEGCLLLGGTLGRNREVSECGSGALDRVEVHPAALDAALHDAVADAGPGELHDHVGGAGQQRHAREAVVKVCAVAPSRRAVRAGLAHRSLDVLHRLTDRHRPTSRPNVRTPVSRYIARAANAVSRWIQWLKCGPIGALRR